MAVTSEAQICNNALLRIGASTISSLTEGTTAANACNQIYAQARDALLRKHFWNFSLVRVALAADSTAPAFGFTLAYTLPANFIRVKDITQQTSNYQIEGSKLLTNQAAPLNLTYVSQVTDVSKFDPLFVEALVLMIIIRVGPRVAGDGFNANPFIAELNQTLLQAQIADAQDSSPGDLDLTFFTNGRHNGGNSWWGW